MTTALAAVGATRPGPDADPDAYIAGTLRVEIFVTGCYLLWRMRAGQAGSSRSWIVWVGVQVAIYLVVLPDLLAGKMNDERTGTGGSLFLFALLTAAGVGLCVLAGFMVLLPVVTILRGLLLAVSGQSRACCMSCWRHSRW